MLENYLLQASMKNTIMDSFYFQKFCMSLTMKCNLIIMKLKKNEIVYEF